MQNHYMFNIEEHDNETTGNFVKVDLKQRPSNPNRVSDINKNAAQTVSDNEEVFGSSPSKKVSLIKRNSKMGVR